MKLSKWLVTFVVLVCSSVVWAKVNINTASISELESLKGIGTKKAEKIIEYREKVGNFKSVEDLINVSGIGSVTLDKIRDEIEVNDRSSSPKTKTELKESVVDKVTIKEQTKLDSKKAHKPSSELKEEEQKDKKSPDKENKDKS